MDDKVTIELTLDELQTVREALVKAIYSTQATIDMPMSFDRTSMVANIAAYKALQEKLK